MLFSLPNSLHSLILSSFVVLGIMINAAICRLNPWLAFMLGMAPWYSPIVGAEKRS